MAKRIAPGHPYTEMVRDFLAHLYRQVGRTADAIPLLRALAAWPTDAPADPKGWLITVAWRKFLDATRTEASRQAREARVEAEPPPGLAEDTDDTLRLYFLCAHPSLSPASAGPTAARRPPTRR